MPTPAPGTQRFLRMREVQDLLAAHGEDMARLNFQGERIIAVGSPASRDEAGTDTRPPANADASSAGARERRRAAWLGESVVAAPRELAAEEAAQCRRQLTELVLEHLRRSSGQDGGWNATFKVSNRELQQVSMATSPLTCAGGRSPWVGQQRFVITFATPQGDARVAVFANVTRPLPVVKAVAPVERGKLITAADVAVELSEDSFLALGRRVPFDSIERLVGMEATRPIQAGEVVFTDSVRMPLLVKRGEEITVIAQGGGIRVRTVARARQDGARGELVQLETPGSRERFDAVVVGQREAVVFSGSPAPINQAAEELPFARLRRLRGEPAPASHRPPTDEITERPFRRAQR